MKHHSVEMCREQLYAHEILVVESWPITEEV